MQLRPYQSEAIDAIRARYAARDRSTLLVLPTGCGKTVVFSEIARRVVDKGGRVLVGAHREELITQADEKLRAVAPDLRVEIEMAEQRASERAQVVVASIQSIARDARLSRWARDHFRLIVIDEAHRAVGSMYRKVLDHFEPARVLGVTATPDRLDKVALGAVFDSVAFTYEIRQAIADGFLVPIRQLRADVSLDLSGIRTKGGDLDEAELERAVLEQLQSIAAAIVEKAGSRQTVAFTPRVQSAHALAVLLEQIAGEGRAAAIDGGTDRAVRADVLERFKRGEIQFLTNCALFTEGWDCPSVSCVAMARPTKSRALYTQCIGRGTRLHPGKRDLLALDFGGNAGRHRLVNPLDVLGGDLPAEVKKRAEELLAEDDELAADEALEQAQAELDAATLRRLARVERGRMQFRIVDPFGLLEIDFDRIAEDDGPSDPTARAFLIGQLRERFKVKDRDVRGLTIAQAREFLRALTDRKRRGLCTWNQAKTLARYGLNANVSFADAKEAIDRLSANGWKRVPDLARDPRFSLEDAAA